MTNTFAQTCLLALGFFLAVRQRTIHYDNLNRRKRHSVGRAPILGGGIGHFLINTNSTNLMVLGGIAWQDTQYQPPRVPIASEQEADALLYAKASFFKFKQTHFDGTVTVLPALSDPGRVRVNTNLSYYLKLFGNLDWNVSFYGNWDNQSPPDLNGSDYGSSSGLSWTFGLK